MRTLITLLFVFGIVRAGEWPQWMGPQRDGVWRETGLLDKFPDDGPKKLWTAKVGIGYAGPAVAGGKVFLTDRFLGEGASNPANAFDRTTKVAGNERILCLDAKTGQRLWKHEYPCTYQISYAAGPRCTPTVDGDRVYCLGAMGDLHCLNVANGEVLWKKNFMKDYAASLPAWGFACHPLVDGDRLVCVAGGSNERLVIAFDKKSGRELWTSQTCPGDFGYNSPTIFDIAGRRQLVVWHSRAVVSLDPDSGKRLWSVPFDSKAALTVPQPRQIGDKLFFTSFYHGSFLLMVEKDRADFVWKSDTKGERPNQTKDLNAIMCTPFVDGEHIYGVCSYGELRCLDLDGKRIWSTMKATRGPLTPSRIVASEEPAENERWSHAFIVKNGDRFFLFNEQGDLIIAKLTPKGYEERSRAHLVDPLNTMAGRGRKVVWMHPAFADRNVFARNDAEIVCYSLAAAR